jgi:solute carrier family 25 protein 34/35
VRLQASTKLNNIAVGYQHNYSGLVEGFTETIRKEGVKGLWRGAEGQVLRVGSGSAVQISTYEQIRNYIETRPFFLQHPSLLPPAAALCTSMSGMIAIVLI